MSEVSKFLEANPVQYLATIGRDGKAKCRPFMFSFEKDGKLWFNTGNQKDVYKDMQENPYVEICISSPSYEWIRVSGKATFVDDKAIKEAALENPIVKGNYQTADNPVLRCSIWPTQKRLLLISPATRPENTHSNLVGLRLSSGHGEIPDRQ